ncbi:hypothetical protein NPS53_09550 [Pseudomonas putida]|uniref:hypothetical protein n=1 Tax=Pseudomonas putida TaxID=303 RepID=UPI0023634DB9|nr:hypothetical protein [Pseudomonas putida]MDD2139822.1 hypothetical protein [Pseudomonas putida]HDS1721746.1 hypothetical protein [Pseudomonas putida]
MALYDCDKGCPKCGGDSGYRFDMVEKHVMGAGWGDPPVSLDSGEIVSQSMAKCDDCGHRFRLETMRNLGAMGGHAQE